MKLRPIIAGPESLTQRLSHFIDLVIKHLCPSIPSYIKDDMEFLNHIPAIVPEETLLTSFDVTRCEAYRKEMELYFITTFRPKLNPFF